MVLTCRPCSDARPTGNVRSTVRHLDAETISAEREFTLDWSPALADASSIGAAATISKQHGGTGSTTRAAFPMTGLA
jgi:hypothetical protein